MRAPFPRRQILLFLLAVTLPCVVVVALGLRLVTQDRELAEKRAADERSRVLSELRQQLAGRLERIRNVAVSAGSAKADASLVFVSRVRNGRITPPWEEVTPAVSLTSQLARDAAGALVHGGEREEFSGRAEAAAALYRKAAASRVPAVAAWARFLLARALASAGQHREADQIDADLAALSFDVTDEHAMPLALYSAQRLLERPAARLPSRFFVNSLDALNRPRWLPPTTLYMLRDIAAKPSTFGGESDDLAARIRRGANDRVATVEHFEALQMEVAAMLPRQGTAGGDHRWHLHGNPPWLVNASSKSDGELVLVAVLADPVITSVSAPDGATAVRRVSDSSGESLGDDFPGLQVTYVLLDEGRALSKRRLQQRFYLAALSMVTSITLLGGYLLWRDVRREMRMASMRAQFVASISHELKTPLTSIRMFADTLRMRPDDPAIRGQYLETIAHESERLTRLLNNVLDFSRIEQARKTYRLSPASLAGVVRAAARALEYQLTQAGFELHVEIDETLPAVRADADAMLQAVLNLLTNAMKFSGASRRIDLTLARDGYRAVVSVTDRGIGIAAREHGRLFERFYRVPTPESDQIAGTGLGLTIVQHIVHAHGGEIAVRSAPGEGSTFSIALPLIDSAQAKPAGRPVEAL